MPKRYVAIWFRYLLADWKIRRDPALKNRPFVFSVAERGRKVVTAANEEAEKRGVYIGMVVADCRAIVPDLQVFDHPAKQAEQLLTALAEWCIRFTPIAAIDLPDGLVLDVSGCTHLLGGEEAYLKEILTRLRQFGYKVSGAMADTIAAAWAISRYGKDDLIIETGRQRDAILQFPPAALRLDPVITGQLNKLGLHQVHQFINMPRQALRRRFGTSLLSRLDQALGQEIEVIQPVQPIVPYEERLPCLEPIRTATGIEIALQQLLEMLCRRLTKEGKGLRNAALKCFRIDNNIQQIAIETSYPSRNTKHLFKLFEVKICQLEPDLGFELFILQTSATEDIIAQQDGLWHESNNKDISGIAELIDKLSGKIGKGNIHRYLPAEHYWPERSFTPAHSFQEKAATSWRTDLPRPIHLLSRPEPIEVSVPMPDYPPMLFRYKGALHRVKKADGPERIEQEWWIEQGLYRDYYCVEDEKGRRYWLFRSGDYRSGTPEWFLHGFFA